MTVYPFTFNIGPLEITGYGLMMMVGFLVGGWLMQRELIRRGLHDEYAADIVFATVISGILGAKLWYVAISQNPGALLSRGGLVWYGGFLGATIGVYLNSLRRRVPIWLTLDLVAPAITAGYALGRVGCFLVQDDYGMPTSLPWGMKFPEGLPPSTAQSMNLNFGIPIPEGVNPLEVLAVHPTQLYEAAIMLGVFFVLWRLRAHKHGTGWLFGAYLAFAGTERFLIELLRAKDDRLLGMFTVAQFTSVVLVTVGVTMLVQLRNKKPVTIPKEAAILFPPTEKPA